MNQFLTGSMGIMFFKFCNIKNLKIVSPKEINSKQSNLKEKKEKNPKKFPMFLVFKRQIFCQGNQWVGVSQLAKLRIFEIYNN